MIKAEKLIIDAYKTIGEDNLLADVTPWFEYSNGVKQDIPIGHKYKVASKKHGLETITVKIKGKQMVEATDDCPLVKFSGLEMRVYVIEGKLMITATATGIALANKANA